MLVSTGTDYLGQWWTPFVAFKQEKWLFVKDALAVDFLPWQGVGCHNPGDPSFMALIQSLLILTVTLN